MDNSWQIKRIEDLERELRNATTVVAILTQRVAGEDGIARITISDIEEAHKLILHKTSNEDFIAYWVTRKTEGENA